MRIKPNSSGTSQSKQGAVLQAIAAAACQQGKARGFTLLEVMVVMVIMAIMSAIAIPAFSSWRDKQSVRNAAQVLLSQMKQARVLAVSENRSVRLTFPLLASTKNTPTDHYVFDSDTSGVCTQCKNETVILTQYSRNLSLTTNKNPISFSSRGTAGNATITLTSGAFSKQITVNLIGRAYLLQ